MALTLAGSVGKGGTNGREDVSAVKARLEELGFEFFPQNDRLDQGLIMAIRLFQSIIKGRNAMGGDGRIDPGHGTQRFLDASNAPRWTTMPVTGLGLVNFEAQQTQDQHDFGTDWLAGTIVGAAETYHAGFLATHPGATPFTVNDVSLPEGGDTPDHRGHETGLACDLRLPRTDGGAGGIKNANTNGAYDRNAARGQLVALRAQPLVSRIFFNDQVLIDEGLCTRMAKHNDHVHFEIRAPEPR